MVPFFFSFGDKKAKECSFFSQREIKYNCHLVSWLTIIAKTFFEKDAFKAFIYL